MKIIHTADIHLDSSLTANLTGAKKRERKDEILKAFKNMVEYAKQNNVTAIIIAGDFFDEKNVSAKTKKVVFELIEHANEIDFLYLCGNHDENVNVIDEENLPTNLKVFGNEVTTYSYGDIAISGIELNSNNFLGFYDDIKLDKTKTNLFVLHGQIDGKLSKDNFENINIKKLQNKNINYLALGHYHTYEVGKLDENGIYAYSGCLEGRGFDETGSKGFVLIEIEGNKLKYKFVNSSIRQLHEIKVDISKVTNTLEQEKLILKAVENVSEKDLVKIVLIGEIELDEKIDVNYLLKQLESKFYFIKIYNHTKFATNIEKLKTDKSLRGEFVRLALSSTLSQEQITKVISMGVTALKGEEVK